MFGRGMIGVLLSFSPLAVACEFYENEVTSESLMFDDYFQSCSYSAYDFESIDDRFSGILIGLSLDEATDHASYWSDWLNGHDTNPMISNGLSAKYIGVGVWVPSELEEQMNDMDAEEWIRSHGVQLSLGFGDMGTGYPRMRIDYRWHEQYDGDFMMQVEMPF